MPEGRILRSVKGIGVITAAYLLSEVVDFKAYSVQKEIEKLAGLNLYEISSGKHKGQRRISKRGRALIRKVLYMVVLNMGKKSGIYYEDYQSYLKRGLKKIEALVIIMKRLLRTVYALVRKNEMFKEGYKIAA
jgi:transposase